FFGKGRRYILLLDGRGHHQVRKEDAVGRAVILHACPVALHHHHELARVLLVDERQFGEVYWAGGGFPRHGSGREFTAIVGMATVVGCPPSVVRLLGGRCWAEACRSYWDGIP